MAARPPLGSLAVPAGALPVQLSRARRSPRAATLRSSLSPSPIPGEMSGVVETAADAVEGSKKLAEEEEKKTPEEEEKKPLEEATKVDMILKSLFEDYSIEMGDSLATSSSAQEDPDDGVAEFDASLADWQAHLRVQKKQVTNELDRYLNEELFPNKKDFDILRWWEMNGPKYPVISAIARDVVAIQASTVASESSFSAGGRTVSDHRSRLKSKMVEALICLQDWLKAADPKPNNKDDKDDEEEEYLVFYQVSENHEETADHQNKDL